MISANELIDEYLLEELTSGQVGRIQSTLDKSRRILDKFGLTKAVTLIDKIISMKELSGDSTLTKGAARQADKDKLTAVIEPVAKKFGIKKFKFLRVRVGPV